MSGGRRSGSIASQWNQEVAVYRDLNLGERDERSFDQRVRRIVAECHAARSQMAQVGSCVSDEEMKKMTRTAVRYVLFKSSDNMSGPVLRKELLEQLKLCGAAPGSRTLPSWVISLAKEELAAVFGLELREIKKVGPRGEDTAESMYIIRSLLPPQLQKPITDQKETDLKCVALVIVSALHLNGGGLGREEFFSMLEDIGFKAGERHDLFGIWEKTMLDVLLKQRYVRLGKGSGAGEEYFVGEIGLDTFSEDEIQDFVQKSKGL